MPITQDRLIKVVAYADTLLDIIDHTRDYVRQLKLDETIMNINSIIDHVDDINTKDALQSVKINLQSTLSLFTEIYVPQKLRDDVAEERIHFKQHAKHNLHMANYHRVKRSMARNYNESVRQVPTFDFLNQNPAGTPEPEGRERLDHTPLDMPSAPRLTIAERIARREAMGIVEEMPIRTNHSIVPPDAEPTPLTPAQLSALRQEPAPALAAVAEVEATPAAKSIGKIKKKIPTEASPSYDPDVISNSVPSLEELNNNGLTPEGTDVL